MRIHPPRREGGRGSAGGEATAAASASGDEIEARLSRIPEARIHDLDVRELLRRGGEPFERIMSAVQGVPRDCVFRLRAIFEPVPLYAVLGDLGFRHWTEKLGAEDWRVWFFRDEALSRREESPDPTPPPIREDAPCGATPRRRRASSGDPGTATNAPEQERTMEETRQIPETEAAVGRYLLDVRKLEGPEKHPTIHRMFDALEPGQALTIVNDHNPKPLYYELRAERPGRFDADGYRAYEAGDRVWVAVLPTLLP